MPLIFLLLGGVSGFAFGNGVSGISQVVKWLAIGGGAYLLGKFTGLVK